MDIWDGNGAMNISSTVHTTLALGRPWLSTRIRFSHLKAQYYRVLVRDTVHVAFEQSCARFLRARR